MDADTMLAAVARIVAAVSVPVTADLEAGYGQTPEAVRRTVVRAFEAGAVGANLEDAVDGALLDAEDATDRVAAAREAAPVGDFVLNARTDAYFVGGVADPFAVAVERAHRYIAAGADCIFIPGVGDAETVSKLVAAIPAPLNIVAGLTAPVTDAPTLFSLGVKRVSVGGSLARASLTALERAGRELLDAGTLSFLEGALAYSDVQRTFGPI